MLFDISFPRECTPQSLAKFSEELELLGVSDGLQIDTSPVRFFTPTALVALAKVCNRRGRSNSSEKIVYHGLNRHDYANNLGFSDALNLKGKPYPQGAFGGETYIPMSAMIREELRVRSEEMGFEIGDAIQERCEDIAKIVSQGKGEELQSVLARSFCEIFRNTFEHGEADAAVFCAQYWKRRDVVEICIADRGIGVEKSLSESKYTKPEDGREALLYSLMPGISSKAWRHKKKKSHQKSLWDNAGYGLFFAHRLFGELGHFFLASDRNALLIQSGSLEEFSCNIEGTLVSMSIDLSDEGKIDDSIRGISTLAKRVKERIGVKSVCFASVEAFLQTGTI
ncbi:hypothetical protein PXK00_11285 [Phaeobacter sp. QD34_3]|uniref:hypothetical protein n=1 Tax=unclassified Phaeobacter TaxID=2621772 RepID=UPI00237FD124|nr:MULTISPECIES: hypothetical protein [unclassified Phaeobacter]MDE4133700.1 hypothetical protein [Phaeobacter sp. QD34_3]MDE4137367.1 hypothetical protein [Phaeobacter sp. QD34_24]